MLPQRIALLVGAANYHIILHVVALTGGGICINHLELFTITDALTTAVRVPVRCRVVLSVDGPMAPSLRLSGRFRGGTGRRHA